MLRESHPHPNGRFWGTLMGVVAPSRQWVRDDGGLDESLHQRAREALDTLGFTVRYANNAFDNDRRYAGTVEARVAGLVGMLSPEQGRSPSLVMALRGGAGAAQLLPYLPWTTWQRRYEEGDFPVLMGFSDFTALNLALLSRGIVSWQGPTLRDLINPDPLTLEALAMALGKTPWKVTFTNESVSPTLAPASMTLEGRLWGGNLTVLTSLMGTPYFPDAKALAGGILFIEDVGEPAYRIDRMLTQLALSGILATQQAVILGDFQGANRAQTWPEDLTLESVMNDWVHRTGVPVMRGLPFGHIHAKTALPVGEWVRLTYHAPHVTLEACYAHLREEQRER